MRQGTTVAHMKNDRHRSPTGSPNSWSGRNSPPPTGRNTTVGDTVRLAFRDITVDGTRGGRPSRTQPFGQRTRDPRYRRCRGQRSVRTLRRPPRSHRIGTAPSRSTAVDVTNGQYRRPLRRRPGLHPLRPPPRGPHAHRTAVAEHPARPRPRTRLRNGPAGGRPRRPQSLRPRRSLSGSVSARPTPTPRRSPSRVATSRSCSSDERW